MNKDGEGIGGDELRIFVNIADVAGDRIDIKSKSDQQRRLRS